MKLEHAWESVGPSIVSQMYFGIAPAHLERAAELGALPKPDGFAPLTWRMSTLLGHPVEFVADSAVRHSDGLIDIASASSLAGGDIELWSSVRLGTLPAPACLDPLLWRADAFNAALGAKGTQR